MPFDYFDHYLPHDDFWCLFAVSLDLEERELYSRYLLAHGDPKKFKWSSPDRAGTVSLRAGDTSLGPALKQMMLHAQTSKRFGSAFEIARSQGREIVFIDAEKRAWTVDGEPTTRKPDHFALPITYKDKSGG